MQSSVYKYEHKQTINWQRPNFIFHQRKKRVKTKLYTNLVKPEKLYNQDDLGDWKNFRITWEVCTKIVKKTENHEIYFEKILDSAIRESSNGKDNLR